MALATQTRNAVRVNGSQATFEQLTTPTSLQVGAHELIDQLDAT